MGMKAMAVCMPGAHILRGDDLRMYMVAIADAKEKLEHVLFVSMGSDVYKMPAQPPSYYTKYAQCMRNLVECGHGRVGFVFGGSANTWKYEDSGVYDEHVRRVCDACRGVVTFVSDGTDMLRGIETVDSIGHASTSSVPVLVLACLEWMLTVTLSKARL